MFALASFEDVWLQNFGPFGVSQEDVLENLIEENYSSQVLTTTKKGTEEGFCSINGEIVTDVTNSPNFYVGRSAYVGDMLHHGQIVRECYAQTFLPARKTEYQCFLSEWRLGEGLGERFCSRQRNCVLSSLRLSLMSSMPLQEAVAPSIQQRGTWKVGRVNRVSGRIAKIVF